MWPTIADHERGFARDRTFSWLRPDVHRLLYKSVPASRTLLGLEQTPEHKSNQYSRKVMDIGMDFSSKPRGCWWTDFSNEDRKKDQKSMDVWPYHLSLVFLWVTRRQSKGHSPDGLNWTVVVKNHFMIKKGFDIVYYWNRYAKETCDINKTSFLIFSIINNLKYE